MFSTATAPPSASPAVTPTPTRSYYLLQIVRCPDDQQSGEQSVKFATATPRSGAHSPLSNQNAMRRAAAVHLKVTKSAIQVVSVDDNNKCANDAALSSSSAPLNTKSSNVSPVPRQEEARGRCHGGDEEPHSGGLPPQHQHRRSLYDHVDDWHSICVANNNQHHVDRLDSSSFSPYSSSSAAKNPAGTPSTTAEHATAGGSTRSSVATTPSRRVAVRSTSVAADITPSHPSSSANKRRKYVHNPYASRTNDGNATTKTPVAAVNPATPTSSPSSPCCATRSFSTTTAAADPMKVQIAIHKHNNLDVFRVLAVDLPPGCTMGDLLALLKSYTPRRNVWMDSSNNRRAYALFDTPLQGYVAYAALDNTSIGTTGPFRFFPEGQLCFSSAGGARRPELRADYMSDRLFDVAHTKARRQVGDGVVPSSKLNGLWGRYVHNAGDENYGQFQLGRGLLVPPPSRLTPVPYPPPPPPSPGSFNQIYGTFIDVYEDRLRKTGVIGPRRRKDLHF